MQDIAKVMLLYQSKIQRCDWSVRDKGLFQSRPLSTETQTVMTAIVSRHAKQ